MSGSVKTSGNRIGWLKSVSALIMDGGDKPPSIDWLIETAGKRVTTAMNDGWGTARENNLPDPDDYKAGWRVIVEEIVELLVKNKLVENNGSGLRWTGPQSGDMHVTWGGRKMLIQQADSRQQSRDRYMTELIVQGRAHLNKVSIIGPRGGIEKKQLEVHPIAEALPQMSDKEFAELRETVETYGIRHPLIMFEDKVLDGRHRLYIASVTGKPVRLEEFTGDDDDARALVSGLNFGRRHMNAAQKAVSIEKLFGEKKRAEAERAKQKGRIEGGKTSPSLRANLPASSQADSESSRWEYQAVKAAGGSAAGVSPRSVRAAAEVVKAPNTLAKVERGEIRSVSQAAREAAAELQKPLPPKNLWSESIKVGLSRARTSLNNVLEELDLLSTTAKPGQLTELLDDIERAAGEIRAALAKRGVS